MGAAYFYHLTRTPVEVTLTQLLDKARNAGWRVAVRGTDAKRLDWLDEKLWLGPEEGFLAHGRAGSDFDEEQPILLTEALDCPNGAACVMAVDGAEVTAEDVKTLERVCILFDGNDESALTRARDQWRSLSDAGCNAEYWSQESGSWTKKASN